MRPLSIYQVDAFTFGPFTGNPAAVCVLADPLPDDLMQKIAAENNLAETAFIIPEGDDWQIRWFTPLVAEVDLCGHATLASAFVVLKLLKPGTQNVTFNSHRSGKLYVSLKEEKLELDFPTDKVNKCQLPSIIKESLGSEPVGMLHGKK